MTSQRKSWGPLEPDAVHGRTSGFEARGSHPAGTPLGQRPTARCRAHPPATGADHGGADGANCRLTSPGTAAAVSTGRHVHVEPIAQVASAAADHGAARHLITLSNGERTVTRLVLRSDLDAVQDLHGRCSAESRYARYHGAKPRLTDADWAHFTDRRRGLSWITTPESAPHVAVALTNLITHPNDDGAHDLGLLIAEAWQSKRLGTALVRLAHQYAADLGGHTLTVSTHRSNHRVLRIMRTLGAREQSFSGGVVDLVVSLSPS